MIATVALDPPQAAIRPTPWRHLLKFISGDVFVLAMLLSLMLLGGDRIALQAGGLTMRLVFPLLMAALGFLYLQRRGAITFPAGLSLLFFLLAVAGAISIQHSTAVPKSIGYTIWVFFDFFIIILLCYNLARLYPLDDVLSLWFLVFRIHLLLIFAEFALNAAHGSLTRPQLWFYEPSYMAIFLTPYFGSSLYLLLRVGRAYALDFFFATLALLVTASATGIVGILFAVILNVLVARQRVKLILWVLALGALFFATLYAFFSDSLYFHLIGGFFLRGGNPFDLLLMRGGDRVIRLLVGWNAFLHNPWTGVGIGADTEFMDSTPLPDIAQIYVQPWTDTAGQPFCNIFVEVLGTMGIVGFIPFCGILIHAAWQGVALQGKSPLQAPVAIAFLIGFFCSILAMQMEGTMLRYYLWSPLGLAFGAVAQLRSRAAARVAN